MVGTGIEKSPGAFLAKIEASAQRFIALQRKVRAGVVPLYAAFRTAD